MKTKRIGKTVGLLGLAIMLAAAGCAGAAGAEKESNEATSSQGAGEGKASGEGLGGKNNSGQEEKSIDYAEIFKGIDSKIVPFLTEFKIC